MGRSKHIRKAKAVELAVRYTPNGGRILEVSCGSGNELLKLRQAGFNVTGTNYTKYQDEPPGFEIRHGVDLIQGLPFEDSLFDTVLLLDVIEHLSDHERAISELTRVCKTNGHVIIMTPNIMKLSSRIDFLFTGFFKLKRDFIGFDVPLESAFAFHNHPVHLPVFLYQLHAHRLSLIEFTSSVYKPKSLIFYLLLWPLVAFATWIKLHLGEKNLRGSVYADEIQKCLTSPAGLCGEFFFVVGCKNSIPASSPQENTTALPKWSTKWNNKKQANSGS